MSRVDNHRRAARSRQPIARKRLAIDHLIPRRVSVETVVTDGTERKKVGFTACF